jgi:DNA/RNA-binding domain of Phe-tRNA-synthetase-like protein
MPVRFHHRVERDDLAFGLVVAEEVQVAPAPPGLVAALDRAVEQRRTEGLSAAEDATRKACRDVLRNGRYKPTGRGKPASEYLLRAAGEGSFPRINGLVDANNLVSLAHCVPVSLWDLDRGGAADYELRLGAAGESYVFNGAGQVLELHDLVCGCSLAESGASTPRVNPVKDGMATKVQDGTTRIAACIYYPLAAGGRSAVEALAGELLRWVVEGSPSAAGATAACLPGESCVL